MRKYILLLIALCLHIAARGQTALDELDLSGLPQPTQAKALRYWFDDDNSSVKTASGTAGTYLLDASGLIEGLHTLHYQITDDSNTLAYVGSRIFLKMNSRPDATSVKSLRYWFDDDGNNVNTISSAGIQTLDVSAMLDGLHTIHYQVLDTDGQASYVASGLFLKMGKSSGAETVRASRLMYWFDDETTIQNVDISQGIQLLDASGLIEGLHTIHYQVLCDNGQMTPAMSSLFLRMNADTETAVAKSLRYWFDEEQTAVDVDITEGVQLLDASGLIEGLHTVHYQIVNSNGTLGAPYSSIFLMMNWDTATTTAKSLRYWFDDETTVIETTIANGTQTLDVSDLTTGLHTLNYQLIDSQGRVTAPVARLFFKNFDKMLADGENRVTKYQYWLNRNSQTMQTVELTDVSNPYTLIALLPMQKEPIQSSQFHFEVTDGVPTIYAKNTLHVRFFDAQNYFSDRDRPFIDYSVEQEVEPVGELQATQTFQRVPENEIRWYTVNVEEGDTVAFRLSQAATAQLFAPSGKEVFKTSESASVQWSGIHTWENGTYYLAVHDVTGSQSNMTLDYMHMDKYAVLSYTPDSIGIALSFLEVCLDGNGYDKLQSATLQLEKDTLFADSIRIVSKSKAILRFSIFGNEKAGMYDLKLHFNDEGTEEMLTIENAIEFIPLIMGDITIQVKSSPITAYPYPVTISVTNTGNMSKLYIPFNIATTFNLMGWEYTAKQGESAWASMYPMNFDVLYEAEDDPTSYSPYTLSFNLFGTGLPGMVLHMFIPILGPHETKDFIMGFEGSGHAKFNLYAWTGMPLNALDPSVEEESNIYSVWRYLTMLKKNSTPNNTDRRRAPGGNSYDNPLGIANNVGRAATQTARNSVGIGLAYGGIINGARLQNIHELTKNDDYAAEVLQDYEASLRERMPTPGQIGQISGIPGWLSGLMGLQQSQASCGTPMPVAHPIEIWAPGDPNDITGYTAVSGSKDVGKDVINGFYTIEFENDPKIANASAHSIVVCDTLDSNVLDLSSFEPQNIKLGKKIIEIKNDTKFPLTVDLRPRINVIAQVEHTYDQGKGIATWTITSLDPMTMEPTDDAMQGVLPVNVDGNGQGEITFNINFKENLAQGTEIRNRASIVFDREGAIMTPVWVNTIDTIAPSSRMTGYTMKNGTEAILQWHGTDEGAGVWRYDLHRLTKSNGMWTCIAEAIEDTVFTMSLADDEEYGFCIVATDSAGNVERKKLTDELSPVRYTPSDANGDGVVNSTDAQLVVNYYLGKEVNLNFAASDVVNDGQLNSVDAQAIQNIYLNSTEGKSLLPRRHKTRKTKTFKQ